MKLSSMVLAFTFAVTSVHSFAQDVRLNPVNQKIETQACYTAATEGYTAATKLIRNNGFNSKAFSASIRCNGVSLRQFAELYSNVEAPQHDKIITLVAKDQDVASKACLDALTMGTERALIKHGLKGETIMCNSKILSDFVRQYKSEKVVVRTFTE